MPIFFENLKKFYFANAREKIFFERELEKTSKEGGRELCELGGRILAIVLVSMGGWALCWETEIKKPVPAMIWNGFIIYR